MSMKRINLPLVLDTFFVALCAFLLFFTAMRYYTKSAVWGLAFGICAFFVFGALAFLYIRKKQNKKLLLSRDEKKKELLELHLSLLPDKDVATLFLPLIEGGTADGKTVVTEKALYFFNFRLKPLSADDIAGVIKCATDKDKVVYCNSLSPEAKELADNFMIRYATSDKLYFELKDNHMLPEKFIFDGTKKQNAFKRAKARFNKSLVLPLVRSGLCLLLFSFFTFYPLYYIIAGGTLLVLSAVCLIFAAS